MELIKASNELILKDIRLSLSYITFQNISVQKQTPSVLNDYIQDITKKTNNILKLEALKKNEIIRMYRDFYWHYLNIDPTKTRPSSEALIRRILANKPIPQINNIVDLNNWVSIDTLIPLGAYDLDLINPPLILRFSEEGETFTPIGSLRKKLKGNEIILADKKNLIIHQFPHRDADESKITLKTKNMLVIACGVPGVNSEKLEQSLIIFRNLLVKMFEEKVSFSKIKTTY